jgi:methionine synthase II (cobalamin-independent)
VQFDCPSHATRTTRDPWRYVNELAKATGKRTWIHVDGDVGFMFQTLIEEYDVDVLNVNLFGREGESNFEAIGKWGRMLRDAGKRLAPAIVNTQISDREEEIESIEMIRSRICRLSSHLGFDTLEAVTPGCGLALLPNTAQEILERLQATIQELG